MKSNRFLTAIALVLAFSMAAPAYGQDPIMSYLQVNASDTGEEVLFLRKDPIVAGYLGVENDSAEEIGKTVSLYAMASSLTVSFATKETNLIIIRTENVNTDDRLNAAALEKYKMPAEVVSAMVETPGWAAGCGVYVFRNRKGRISISVGIIDTRLDRIAEKLCTSNIIARSFGIGLGPKMTLPGVINHLKYAYLLNIISGCEAKHGANTHLSVEVCANEAANNLSFGR
jgi:hypothetical protein